MDRLRTLPVDFDESVLMDHTETGAPPSVDLSFRDQLGTYRLSVKITDAWRIWWSLADAIRESQRMGLIKLHQPQDKSPLVSDRRISERHHGPNKRSEEHPSCRPHESPIG